MVRKVATDLGLFDVTSDGFVMREIAPGFSVDEVLALTEADVQIDPDLQEFRV